MDVKINIGACITLYNILNKILFDNTDPQNPVEREIPFNVRYKLQRVLAIVEKDYFFFNDERNKLIDEIGILDESKNLKRVPDEKIPEFKDALMNILKTQITHDFYKLKPEDLETINIKDITTDEMNIFIMTLVDDKEFLNAVSSSPTDAQVEVETV